MFYDFGMMCETAKSKADLLDVFFGIYEKDSNKVLYICRCSVQNPASFLRLSIAQLFDLSMASVITALLLCSDLPLLDI